MQHYERRIKKYPPTHLSSYAMRGVFLIITLHLPHLTSRSLHNLSSASSPMASLSAAAASLVSQSFHQTSPMLAFLIRDVSTLRAYGPVGAQAIPQVVLHELGPVTSPKTATPSPTLYNKLGLGTFQIFPPPVGKQEEDKDLHRTHLSINTMRGG